MRFGKTSYLLHQVARPVQAVASHRAGAAAGARCLHATDVSSIGEKDGSVLSAPAGLCQPPGALSQVAAGQRPHLGLGWLQRRLMAPMAASKNSSFLSTSSYIALTPPRYCM